MVAEGIGLRSSPKAGHSASLYIYNLVRLFVCLFAIWAKTTAQNATKPPGIIKWGSVSVLHGLKLPVLQFLKRYTSISGFLFAADDHFINYWSLDFRLSVGLIRCRSTIDFKLGRRYSSYLRCYQLTYVKTGWGRLAAVRLAIAEAR